MSYLTPNYYLQPGWYYPAPRASSSGGGHHYSSSVPSAAGVFIPSPPAATVPLPSPPAPVPVYPPRSPRARRHSFHEPSHLHPAQVGWSYYPSPSSPWAYPYSWFYDSRSLPAPSLHTLLDGSLTDEHVSADLSAHHLSLRWRGRPLQSVDRDSPATHPHLARVKIVCDAIPQWPVEVALTGSTVTPSRHDRPAIACITVGDILHAIHGNLQTQITHDEWARLTAAQEVDVARAYTRRYKSYAPVESDVRRAGVKRVDFLGKNIYFRGLVWLTPENGVERVRLLVDSRDDSHDEDGAKRVRFVV